MIQTTQTRVPKETIILVDMWADRVAPELVHRTDKFLEFNKVLEKILYGLK